MSRFHMVGLVTLQLVCVPASATPSKPWAKVGSWTVAIDPTLGNGCFVAAEWVGGSIFRVGLDPRERLTSYLVVGNEKWKSIEIGKKYKLSMKFDDDAPWSVPVTVINMNGSKAFYGTLDDEYKFLDDMSTKLAVRIFYGETQVDGLRLNGSNEAFKAMLECQKSQLPTRSKKTEDPFATTISSESSDPFTKP